MPQAIAAVVTSIIATTAGTAVASGAFATAFASAVGNMVFGATLNFIGSALMGRPSQPPTPKPEDGSLNFKQAIPSLCYVLGQVRKGGDYAFFEERNGTAYHIIVMAGHQVAEYVAHWFHDEKITLTPTGAVSAPAHFAAEALGTQGIATRLGLNAELPYAGVVSAFPKIWTAAHRGDGLASVMMWAKTVKQESYLKVYPNQSPNLTSEMKGMPLFDPRTGQTAWSANIALMRLWHMTSTAGFKLRPSDMYLPDWERAADICDDMVTNRAGRSERRYHGGMWFRAENDPTEVGRIMDQAAELVIYERADGKVGVHAGEMTAPSVRLDESSIIAVKYQANRSEAATVAAVRGEYTDPTGGLYVTRDAAPYGDPYADAAERTRTVENQLVQSHNHISRMQKLAYIRANAPRVSVLAHYEPAQRVLESRFVGVHWPQLLVNSIVEITGRPRLSLRNLTVEFQGIVVPASLYNFDAASEEGAPGEPGEILVSGGVPKPVGFDVSIRVESIAAGGSAAYALATWQPQDPSFTYELEFEPVDGSDAPRRVFSEGSASVRSAYLADGKAYRFRLRTWSSVTSSDWSEYAYRTATIDQTPPEAPSDVIGTGAAGAFEFRWTAPASANYRGARLWLGDGTFAAATLVATEYGAPGETDSRTIPGLAAGTYYGWVEAFNASGTGAAPVVTGAVTVTEGT